MKITKRQLRTIIRESILLERKFIPIMVPSPEFLASEYAIDHDVDAPSMEVMNRVANYALAGDMKGALADTVVNTANLDMILDTMAVLVDGVESEREDYADFAVVPGNWDANEILEFFVVFYRGH